MKTVEVAVEYVLVGLLALFAFALPFFPGALDPAWLSSEKIIGILGLAYLFGVVFDKIADTMLAPHEQCLRIAQACKNRKERRDRTGDPFPQDRLENSVRSAGDGRLEWMDALRGRIRTTRGLAVFGLPAALGIVLYLGKSGQGAAYRLGMIVPVALLCLCIGSSIIFSIVRTSPKTGDLKKKDKKDIVAASKAHVHWGLSFLVLMLFIAAMGGMVVVPLWSGRYELALVGVAGTVIALLSWWAWHGITRTYMRFLAMQMDAEGGE